MALANKTKIFIGLIFIVAAFICVAAIFYFMGNAHQANLERIASMEAQMANLIAEKAAVQLPPEDARKVRRQPVKVEDMVARAETVYGAQERGRREGVLWIDRKSSVCIITLGAVHGLQPGSILDVYQNDQQVAQVTVDTPLDIISYVTPLQKSLEQFDRSYYRVVISR